MGKQFDYANQAWYEDTTGTYIKCGHPSTMDCGCYGKLHEGESIIIVCEIHQLGLGCDSHCHIMNDCAPCYQVMEATAKTVLENARNTRRNACMHCRDTYDQGTHCPDCNACRYQDASCENLYCEGELID